LALNPFSKNKSPITAPDPNPAHIIGRSLQAVGGLRACRSTNVALNQAVDWVKLFQHRRFECTYSDLIRDAHFSATTQFFLNRLYGPSQPHERDAQFARIAPTISKIFSDSVVNTAVKVSVLHELTESLDHQMGCQVLNQIKGKPVPTVDSPSAAELYVRAWQATGARSERLEQLQQVLALGHTMGELVKVPGLLIALKVMRGPAQMAQLGELQNWLEDGFSTFKQLCKKPKALDHFLITIQSREMALIEAMFHSDVHVGTKLLQHAVVHPSQ
jgi:hypothetical protein